MVTPLELLGIKDTSLPGPQAFKEFLGKRGFDENGITKHGFQYITAEATSKLLGQEVGSDAVALPYYDHTGKPLFDEKTHRDFIRVRLLRVDGSGKYRQRKFSHTHIYLSPVGWDWEEVQSDNKIPILITEGEFKAATANRDDSYPPTIGLSGVENWSGKAWQAPITPELMAFNLTNRRVYICFDADEGEKGYKAEVWSAMVRFTAKLKTLGAIVQVVDLHKTGITGKGLDDYILAGGTWDALCDTAHSLDTEELSSLNKMLGNYALLRGRETVMVYDVAKDETITISSFRILTADQFTPGDKRPALTSRLWECSPRKMVLNGVIFDPAGTPGITAELNLNTWRGLAVEPKPNAELLARWLDMIDRFFVDEPKLIPLFHCWAGQIFQKPEERNLTSWAIISQAEGIGKSLIGELLAKAMGIGEGNPASILAPDDLFSQYNSWMKGCVLAVVNEPSSDSERHTRMMKALRSNDTFDINIKFGLKYTVKNYLNLWVTTNEGVPFGMSENSRRDIVYHPRSVASDPEWKTEIRATANLLKKPEGLAAIADFYMNTVDLSEYDPMAPAPDTQDKRRSSQESQPLVEQVARSIILAFGPEAIIPLTCLRQIADVEGIRAHRKLTATVRRLASASTSSGEGRVSFEGEQIRCLAFSNVADRKARSWFITRLPDSDKHVAQAMKFTMKWREISEQ